MKLTDNALTVLKKRYFKKDKEGNVNEDWQQLVSRVAKDISGDQKDKYDRYVKLLDSGCFLFR